MSDLMKWSLIALASGMGLCVVDWVLLKLEGRGYIYYRKTKGRGGSVGSALMEMHGFLEPPSRCVVEAKKETVQQDEDGAPPAGLEEACKFTVAPLSDDPPSPLEAQGDTRRSAGPGKR